MVSQAALQAVKCSDAIAQENKTIITMNRTDFLMPDPMRQPSGEMSAAHDAVAQSGIPEDVAGTTETHGQQVPADAEPGNRTVDSQTPGTEAAQGGEFQLLLETFQSWLAAQGWQPSLPILKRSLMSLMLLLVVCIVLRLEGGFVSTVNSIPLLGKGLMLVGLARVALFAKDNLLRQDDRKNLNQRLQQLIRETIG